jgi:hypothetical protein
MRGSRWNYYYNLSITTALYIKKHYGQRTITRKKGRN